MSPTVLIVDDSIPLHKLVKAHLENEAFSFHSAYDGQSALTAAAAIRPSLILLDVDMPQLDGFEVCRRLKLNPLTAGIPLIFLTADTIVADRVKGLDLGAMDYISKPFKPEELRARVRAALRSKHQLDKTAMIDGVTGLWNRAYLHQHLPGQLSLAKRLRRPVACVMCDVDHLTSINLKHGEAVGDEVVRAVAGILVSQCRAEDLVCRFDGGKFAIVAGGAKRTAAAHMADRLRADVERQLRQRNGLTLNVTCSFGVADCLGSGNLTLVERADAALGRAKQIGRNCVSVSHKPGDDSPAVTAA